MLYSGIAGGDGCITQPPILNKAEELEQFKSIERKFFACRGKWTMFTRSSTVTTTLPANIGVKIGRFIKSRSQKRAQKILGGAKIIKSLNNRF